MAAAPQKAQGTFSESCIMISDLVFFSVIDYFDYVCGQLSFGNRLLPPPNTYHLVVYTHIEEVAHRACYKTEGGGGVKAYLNLNYICFLGTANRFTSHKFPMTALRSLICSLN